MIKTYNPDDTFGTMRLYRVSSIIGRIGQDGTSASWTFELGESDYWTIIPDNINIGESI